MHATPRRNASSLRAGATRLATKAGPLPSDSEQQLLSGGNPRARSRWHPAPCVAALARRILPGGCSPQKRALRCRLTTARHRWRIPTWANHHAPLVRRKRIMAFTRKRSSCILAPAAQCACAGHAAYMLSLARYHHSQQRLSWGWCCMRCHACARCGKMARLRPV